MADLTITATSVAPGTGAKIKHAYAGESITAGQPIRLDTTTGLLMRSDANVSATTAKSKGIALHAASLNQPLSYQHAGEMNLGATLDPGTHYFVSANVGGIAPHADLAATWTVTRVGYAKSASVFVVDVEETTVTKV